MPSFRRSTLLLTATLAGALLAGCHANPLTMSAPSRSTTLAVPKGTDPQTVIDCAERSIQTLARGNSHWIRQPVVKDIPGGRFETGDFDEENIIGFRVRLVVKAGEPAASAALTIKGAGPYFSDLGVDAAMNSFVDEARKCLQ